MVPLRFWGWCKLPTNCLFQFVLLSYLLWGSLISCPRSQFQNLSGKHLCIHLCGWGTDWQVLLFQCCYKLQYTSRCSLCYNVCLWHFFQQSTLINLFSLHLLPTNLLSWLLSCGLFNKCVNTYLRLSLNVVIWTEMY